MPRFDSRIELTRPAFIRGYVLDQDRPDRRWVVGLFRNGDYVGSCHAIEPTAHWAETLEGAEDCGFEFNVTRAAFGDTDRLRLHVLNTDHFIADIAIRDEALWRAPTEEDRPGFVRHAHGVTLAGVLEDMVTEHPSYEVLALEGERIVGRTRLFRWQHVGNPKNPMGRRVGFELLVDHALADGEPHVIRVETSTGQQLVGSPVTMLALPNAFREACQAVPGRARSRMADMALDRLLDNAVPLLAYGDLFPEATTSAGVPLKTQGYALYHHHSVTPIAAVSAALAGQTAPILYFDLAVQTRDGLCPLLLSAFDYERQLEQGTAALLFALRADLAASAASAGLESPSEIFFHALEQTDHDLIRHVPRPGGVLNEAALADFKPRHLAALEGHVERMGIRATLGARPGGVFPAVHLRRHSGDRAVSVIIPTRNEGEMLWDCIDGLRQQNPGFSLDLIVIDNGSDAPGTRRILERITAEGGRVLRHDGGFNYALMNTRAARLARHEQLCLLNNDVSFPQPGVLEELCSRLADPSVAVVGPLMVRASDIIQHGGVVLGPQNGACHAFEDRMLGDPGYGEVLRVAHECSAVTGALMLTRKSLFERMGGFDAQLFPVNFNDVDYCLRLREAGYRVVFSPHVHVRHFDSTSRGRENRSPSANRMFREVQNLRERWGDVIRSDPFFHPQFARDTLPYRALASVASAPLGRTRRDFRAASLPTWR